MRNELAIKKQEKILLLNLPWASLDFPSLALSTLKSALVNEGHHCEVMNLNLLFGKMVGIPNYEEISREQHIMLGEQVFSELLFPEKANDHEFNNFLNKVLDRQEFNRIVTHASEFIEESARLVVNTNPHYVGFTTNFFQTMASVALAQEIRKIDGEIITLFGGAACEEPMGKALMTNYPCIDFTFSGESDHALIDFINCRASNEESPVPSGSIYHRLKDDQVAISTIGRPVNLSQIPSPDHSDYLKDLKQLNLEQEICWSLTFEASRGCWWGEKSHCTFCGLNGQQMKFRHKDPDVVFSQLKELSNSYEKAHVLFSDNILHYDYFENLLPQLATIKNLTYFFEVKSNLKEKHIKQIWESGITTIQPGIERLNDKVLGSMKKGNTSAQNVQLLKFCAEYGIKVLWNMILNFPAETNEDILKEIELIESIMHLPPPGNVGPIRVDRYSPYHKTPEELGVKLSGPSTAESFMHYRKEQLQDICYHFDFQLSRSPSKDVKDALVALERLIEEWQQSYAPGQLTQSTKGDKIRIIDARDTKEPLEIVLKGTHREIYRYCTSFQRISKLESIFGSKKEIDNLLEMNLMVEVNGKVMSSAVRDTRSLTTDASLE